MDEVADRRESVRDSDQAAEAAASERDEEEYLRNEKDGVSGMCALTRFAGGSEILRLLRGVGATLEGRRGPFRASACAGPVAEGEDRVVLLRLGRATWEHEGVREGENEKEGDGERQG